MLERWDSSAKYTDGKKDYSVKISDVKNEVSMYANYNPAIVENKDWFKDYIFDRFVFIDAAYFEEINKGFTNQPGFNDSIESQYQKQYLTALYQKGQEILNKKAAESKFEIVKVSHILLAVNKFTNIKGETKQLSDADFQKLSAERENKALNLIDSLKASKNLDNEFSNIAATQSDDAGSAPAGGNVGYFTKGLMVKEFEEAVFSAKGKGLLDKPVKTSYGYHIIYITDPDQKKTMKEYEKSLGKDEYKKIEPYLQNSFYESERKQNYKEFYTVNISNKTIQLDGKDIKMEQLTDDAKLFEIYGKPYNWKRSKEIILYFIPTFMNDISIQSFNDQMINLRNFIHIVEVAKKNGIEKSKAFINDMIKFKDDSVKKVAAQIFEKDFVDASRSKITPDIMQNYYNTMKNSLTKNVNGKSVQMTYKEAENTIKDELEKSIIRQDYQQWKGDMKKKYKVTYDEKGIGTLQDIERDILKQGQKNLNQQSSNSNKK